MELGRLDVLIELLAQEGRGVTVRPVGRGQVMGGVGSSHRYAFDGWEVGWMAGMSGGELAVGDSLEEAVEAAIAAVESI